MNAPAAVRLSATIDGETKFIDFTLSQITTLAAYVGDHSEFSDIGMWALAQVQAALPPIMAAYHLDPGVQAAVVAQVTAQKAVEDAIAAAATLGTPVLG